MNIDPEQQILNGSEKSEKFFAFSEQDPTRPAQWWFQHSPDGLVLFTVFYTMACRWNLCQGCNLPTKSSLKSISYRDIIAQIDYLLNLPEIKHRKEDVHKIIVSNNGSVLDQVTFPSTALMYLLAKINLEFPKMSILSIETRVEYVEWEELEFIARALKERANPAELEIAIGMEAFDDRIRNQIFKKGLSLDELEKLVEMIGRYNYSLKCYFMQKPVTHLDDEKAIDDVQQAIDWLHHLRERYNVQVNMHLNPTFVAYGTALERAFLKNTYEPPRLHDVARAALRARGTGVSVFLGLNDEGLALPGGSFIREGEEKIVEKMELFNQSQDFALLEEIISAES